MWSPCPVRDGQPQSSPLPPHVQSQSGLACPLPSSQTSHRAIHADGFQESPSWCGGHAACSDKPQGPLRPPRSQEVSQTLLGATWECPPCVIAGRKAFLPPISSLTQKGSRPVPHHTPSSHLTLLTCPATGECTPSQRGTFAFQRVECIPNISVC